MRTWRNMLMALILLGSAALSARAQYMPAPLTYQPNLSAEYYPPGPGSTYFPVPPYPGAPIPRGAPIPGADNPKEAWERYLEAEKKKAKGNPLVMYADGPNAF